MIVLGVDPGFATVGWGVVAGSRRGFRPVSFGVIRTRPETPFVTRLSEIYDDLTAIVDRFKPDESAVEELFFNTNQKTVIQVGQARGVILLALKKNNLPVYEYTPLQVKNNVCGYGRAEKSQVMEMTRSLLGLDAPPKPDDAADALALALAHIQTTTSLMRNL